MFLTHGKNRTFIESMKKLLAFGKLEAVVSAERQSVSQPVPDKVMSDMRSCGAAIIHVDDEMRLLDKSAQEHVILNPNVLFEIGAAMALYWRRSPPSEGGHQAAVEPPGTVRGQSRR